MPAAQLEEAVWQAIYDLLSDPQRIKRQWKAHVEREWRKLLRGYPDREAWNLAERLHKLERRSSGFIDLAADALISREDVRTKLADLDGQCKGSRQALREAKGRQQSIKELEQQWHIYAQLVEHFDRITYLVASDADRRRLYQALRLQVNVDEHCQVRHSGIFDPDVYLPDVLQDFPRDPSKPLPKVPP
jgi:hypothetical protein